MMPKPSAPGKIAFAMIPAMKPRTIQPMMPMSCSRFVRVRRRRATVPSGRDVRPCAIVVAPMAVMPDAGEELAAPARCLDDPVQLALHALALDTEDDPANHCVSLCVVRPCGRDTPRPSRRKRVSPNARRFDGGVRAPCERVTVGAGRSSAWRRTPSGARHRKVEHRPGAAPGEARQPSAPSRGCRDAGPPPAAGRGR